MADSCTAKATIPELLDALETEVEALRSLAALAVQFANVSPADIEDWLANRAPIPAWVLIALHRTVQLTPSARRKLSRQPLGHAIIPVQKVHPFSRIEDL